GDHFRRIRRVLERQLPDRLSVGPRIVSTRNRRKRRRVYAWSIACGRGASRIETRRIARRDVARSVAHEISRDARERNPRTNRRERGWLVPAGGRLYAVRARQAERRADAHRLERRRRHDLHPGHGDRSVVSRSVPAHVWP